MAMDAGRIDRGKLVGQSGKTVAPKLYVAVGISGASHHIAGIRCARTIIAINPDPTAPIFRIADLGLIGHAERVIPAILDSLGHSDKSASSSGTPGAGTI